MALKRAVWFLVKDSMKSHLLLSGLLGSSLLGGLCFFGGFGSLWLGSSLGLGGLGFGSSLLRSLSLSWLLGSLLLGALGLLLT